MWLIKLFSIGKLFHVAHLELWIKFCSFSSWGKPTWLISKHWSALVVIRTWSKKKLRCEIQLKPVLIKTFHSGPQRKTPLSSSRSDITVSWIMSVDVLDLFFCTILKKKQPRRSNSFLGILFRSHHWPWHWAINQMALVAIRVTCPTPFEATLPSLTIVIFLESKEYYPLHHLPL